MLEIIDNYSLFGLFFLILIEEAGIPLPIPGDIFIGFASALSNSNYFLIITAVITATLLGSTILFTISKKIGYKLLARYGNYIKFTPKKIKKVERWFGKYGGWTIIIARLIPGFRTITPFAAGLFNFPYKKFWLSTIVAAFIWANIYFIIGKFFGDLLQKLVAIFT